MSVQETYFGWTSYEHTEGCRGRWDVSSKATDRHHKGTGHECRNEDCEHAGRFSETVVRIVCRTCERAYLITGEGQAWESTSTARLGYGSEPIKVRGLYLYPGELWATLHPDPVSYLVAARKVERLEQAHVVGAISRYLTPRHAERYMAAAGAAVTERTSWKPYDMVSFTSNQDGFKTRNAAAAWIANFLQNPTSEPVSQAPEGGLPAVREPQI